MLTIFTIPKAFKGHINVIQRNAIQSWLKLLPGCEIILFGDDKGVAEAANEFDLRHIPGIEKNEFGTPLLDSAFKIAQKSAKNNILVYANADIIFTAGLASAIKRIDKPLFLMSGRRWDLDINEEINFDGDKWKEKLHKKINEEGKLHGFSGIDYFVFPRKLPHNLPPFAVGRIGWDNWLIYHIRSLKIPIIDATEAVTIIHQNHDFSHSPWANEKKRRVEGPEAESVFRLAGGFSKMLTLREANWVLASGGLKKPTFPRRIVAEISLFYPWRLLLSIKRKLQNLLKC